MMMITEMGNSAGPLAVTKGLVG